MSVLKALSLFSLSTLLVAPASAHTWIEQFRVISSNGTYIGDPGYPRGYMARTDPGFNGFYRVSHCDAVRWPHVSGKY